MVGARQRLMVVSSVGPLPAGRSRPELVAEVAARLDHLPVDATLVVACSGGPDSTALAHLVSEARQDLRLTLVHVAHGLRDRSDDLADREVVATHASWLGAELVVCDVEVASSGLGIEAAARDARYGALRSTARRCGATAIAVGHSADDQAETVLLRLARGTGTDGLGAMQRVSGDLVRPLLRIRRADLHDFVAGEGLPVTTDATNEAEAIRRVRVRREVLPALQRIGPDPVATLGRLADLARDDGAALAAVVDDVPDAFRTIGPVVALRTGALRGAPVAIARRLVRRAMEGLVDTPPSAATVSRVLDAPVGDAATLPGNVAFRAEPAWRTLVVADPRRRVSDVAGGSDGVSGGSDGVSGSSDGVSGGFEGMASLGGGTGGAGRDAAVSLAAPGTVVWEAAGLTLRVFVPESRDPLETHGAASSSARSATGSLPTVDQIALALPGVWAPPRHRVEPRRIAPGTVGSRYAVVLPAAAAGWRVRAGVPGDRIRGPGGTRRVADVLRDAGMPRAIRPRWPVVCEADDESRIVWIPGVAADAGRLAEGARAPAVAVQASPS